jgi:hypothetical protein
MKNQNKLIAEFMCDGKQPSWLQFENDDEYDYHTSWDWLKPVVDEIEMRCEGVPKELLHLSLFSTREEVYQAVVEFIKHYN